jgi:uncharacterized membrane protein (UPF0127 family)
MNPIRTAAVSAALLVSALVASFGAPAVADDSILPLSAFPRETLAIETRSARRHMFEAWRADTARTQQQGLMFVKDIRPDQAMIFVYQPPQLVAMWMKNTLLPLDMLFVDPAGCVVKVEHDARPRSLDIIKGGVPVSLVVELKGGSATELGIGIGDRVLRPQANWPSGGIPCTRHD